MAKSSNEGVAHTGNEVGMREKPGKIRGPASVADIIAGHHFRVKDPTISNPDEFEAREKAAQQQMHQKASMLQASVTFLAEQSL